MIASVRIGRVTAFAWRVVAFALVGGCSATDRAPSAATDAGSTAALPARDTAFLAPKSLELAGLERAQADSLPWSEAWRAPARVVLDPAGTQSLGAIAEGRVSRVLVNVGDRVAAGQLLVAIHSHELTDARSAAAAAAASATSAEAALSVARSAAARAERLLAMKAMSQADAERARGELALAEATHARARAEVVRTRAMLSHLGAGNDPSGHEVLVRAPASGVIVSRDAQPGAVVLVGAALVTVSRTTALLLAMQLPERATSAVRQGAEVRFHVSALPDLRFRARVERVAPSIDSVTRTISVLARPVGDAPMLRAEMSGEAEMMGVPGARTLVVPSVAVQAMDGDTVVITGHEQRDGLLIEAVRVRVGRRTLEHAEILSGLAPGTPVVTKGAAVAKAEILRRRGEE